MNFFSVDLPVLALPCDLQPVNKDRSVGLVLNVNDGSLRNVGAFVGVDDVVEKVITGNILVRGTLDCFQFVGAVLENSFLNESQHNWECLSLVRVVLVVEAILAGAEDLGQADGVTTEVVNQHVVRLALLADGSGVVLGAAQDVNVTLTLR